MALQAGLAFQYPFLVERSACFQANTEVQGMAKISQSALAEVQEALANWTRALEGSALAKDSKTTYIDRVERFVRWLNDQYSPPPPV